MASIQKVKRAPLLEAFVAMYAPRQGNNRWNSRFSNQEEPKVVYRSLLGHVKAIIIDLLS